MTVGSKIMEEEYFVINEKNGGKGHGLKLGQPCITWYVDGR